MNVKIINVGRNKTQVSLTKNILVFVSYKTPVAMSKDGQFFRTNKFHSVTTSRHIRLWLESSGLTQDEISEVKEIDQSILDKILENNNISF